MTRLALASTCALLGCASSLGVIDAVAPRSEQAGVKLLRPAAVGRSCRVDVFGISIGRTTPPLPDALAQIVALDAEGDVIRNAEVTSSQFVSGIYNRRCVEVRGDLARMIRTITLPAPASHRGHH